MSDGNGDVRNPRLTDLGYRERMRGELTVHKPAKHLVKMSTDLIRRVDPACAIRLYKIEVGFEQHPLATENALRGRRSKSKRVPNVTDRNVGMKLIPIHLTMHGQISMNTVMSWIRKRPIADIPRRHALNAIR